MSDPVVIVDYDPAWPARFEQERARLAAALAGLFVEIEHIGSTSVPGLSAKPVIDILITVRHFGPIAHFVEPLQSLGYTYHHTEALDGDSALNHHFFRDEHPRTRHIHIHAAGSYQHRRVIAFRDYLRAHPDALREYDALKRTLAACYGSDRAGYTDAKEAFVRAIEAKAMSGEKE